MAITSYQVAHNCVGKVSKRTALLREVKYICLILPGEVRAKKPTLTQPRDQRLKGDFRTTTNCRAGGLLARPGSLSGHPSKQQPRSTLLDPVILR
ncbi:hypothetical protein J6590_051163 [Homalodisca vitripennis]|nr:hypothetical protein J6590_051163 [Homalodisca vitripennis]